MRSPATLRLIVAALAVGAAASGAGWWFWLKPQLDVARLRSETTADVLTLYGLQMRYHQRKRTYANDLDSLLALEPDGAARKARMNGHLDLSTLAIVGDATKFKIEANVLDLQRTLIKIRGPIRDRPAPRPEVIVRETGLGLGGDGRPVAPTPAPAPAPRAR
jgi:hypothetical protein